MKKKNIHESMRHQKKSHRSEGRIYEIQHEQPMTADEQSLRVTQNSRRIPARGTGTDRSLNSKR
jgi:hypothetical protein